MARIAGVDLPRNKKVFMALTSIYGIGHSRAREIVLSIGLSLEMKTEQISEKDVLQIRNYIEKKFKVEGEARSEVYRNIKRLMEIGCYRGVRHKLGLPVRGQRTHTNARTRKRNFQGRKLKVSGKKKGR